ncbi:hypothetical protein F4779DRAFT_519829 [Xylariaceae sp. FL0662B]|nr:hypothetical protein F4779DRAFT_519829 [Xylariaceae sp. FL0662B]
MENVDDETTAMAQAMGFSNFGAQNASNKRRKFNPRADAVVASSSSTSAIPSRRDAVSELVGSGSNALPLGVRIQNDEEINLDSDQEDGVINPKTGNGVEGDYDNDDPEPQYLDASYPPVPASVDLEEVQSKIDAIVGSSAQGLQAESSSYEAIGIPGSRGGQGGRQANRGHGRDMGKEWWEDYYDPSSNVNPWERLERFKGLETRGSWMAWEEAKAQA